MTAQDEGHKLSKSDNRDFLNQLTLEFVQRLLQGKPMQLYSRSLCNLDTARRKFYDALMR